MIKYLFFFGYLIVVLFYPSTTCAQTLPVGTPFLEETWRRLQISGERDINSTFSIRPIYANEQGSFDSIFFPGSVGKNKPAGTHHVFAKGKGSFRLLPATLKTQYNTHHPYGWNDGSMIQNRGYQAQLTAGIYTKLGPLTVQLQPELVYAQNKYFETLPSSYSDDIWQVYYQRVLNKIDNPERFGDGNYTKLLAGQSSIKFQFKKLSLGVSTENLWWGPGIRNSLLMSNSAPGFAHITFNSNAPITSPIGYFEWQVISGKLKGSGILPPDTGRKATNGLPLYSPKPEDDRYLNGMIVTWQPKWVKGLQLGFSRLFYQYDDDVPSGFDGYFPVIGTLFKGRTNNEDAKKRDQMLSVFIRLLLPAEKAEIYAEFGRNDHSQNFRDLALEPEHSSAYIIGGRKIFETAKLGRNFELMMEFANLQPNMTGLLRDIPTWYTHHQVRHGYTNRGQLIGAGIGPGSASQTIAFNWLNGIKVFGVTFERVVWNNDFYYAAFGNSNNFGSHWVDLSISVNKSWYNKRFIYTANLAFIRSLNYQWRHELDANGDSIDRNANNLAGNLSVSYLF
ncbi:MAG: hypothetical protein E6Q24_15785 [Chitinophagaceae bacterium]|nr:MAG: hypothetical protein E6Q24_15785 [Chitinophagaceae bacterium]